MNGITSVAKKAFKFHCDSINMIEDNSDSVPYKSFKFHCDSINIQTEAHSKQIILF